MDPGKHPGRTDPCGVPPGGLDFRIEPDQSLTVNGNIFHILMRFLRLPLTKMDGILPSMRLLRSVVGVGRADPTIETTSRKVRHHIRSDRNASRSARHGMG